MKQEFIQRIRSAIGPSADITFNLDKLGNRVIKIKDEGKTMTYAIGPSKDSVKTIAGLVATWFIRYRNEGK